MRSGQNPNTVSSISDALKNCPDPSDAAVECEVESLVIEEFGLPPFPDVDEDVFEEVEVKRD